eukprot:12252201-Alexandrium_andersonii.AAC.1
MRQAPTAGSGYGPCRSAALGSAPARRTHTRRLGWPCRRATRMRSGHRGPRGASRGARRHAPPARA